MLNMMICAISLSLLFTGCKSKEVGSTSQQTSPTFAATDGNSGMEPFRNQGVSSSTTSTSEGLPNEGTFRVTLDGKTVNATAVVNAEDPNNKSYTITLYTGEKIEKKLEMSSGHFVQMSSQGKYALILDEESGGSGGDSLLSTLTRENGNLVMKELHSPGYGLKELTAKNAPTDLVSLIANKKLGYLGFNAFHGSKVQGEALIRDFRVGFKPSIFYGSAQYHYNFAQNTLEFDKITSYKYDDPLQLYNCKDIIISDNGYSITEKNIVYNAFMAASNGRVDIINMFAMCGQTPDIQTKYSEETPLIASIESGDLKMVKELINIGADPKLKTKSYTPYLAAGYLENSWRDSEHKLSDIRKYLEPYATESDKATLKLLKLPDPKDIPQLLKTTDVNVNLSDIDGYNGTPLGIALAAGRIDIAKVLLENGADPSLRFGTEEGGITPIVYVLDKHYYEFAKLMHSRGVDFNGDYHFSYLTYTLLGHYLSSCDAETTSFLVSNGATKVSFFSPIDGEKEPTTDPNLLIKACKNKDQLLNIVQKIKAVN